MCLFTRLLNREIKMSASIVQGPSRVTNVFAWGVQALLAAAFLAAAGAKLAGVPMLVQVFAQIGLGQWFRILTALVEITGVIALLLPGFAVLGGLWLGTTMVFAVLAHLFILHSSPAGAVVLLVLSGVVVWLRRDQLGALRERFL
jgi:hypothetical protein